MSTANLSTEPIQQHAHQLDAVADHALAARNAAAELRESFLTYLLDMVLVELAKRGSPTEF